jgi:DNA-binding Lrp family transcriptional regulator
MSSSFDDIDRAIIRHLLADGRASVDALAAAADASEATVSFRRAKLEATDVVRGYAPAVNYEALGVRTVLLRVRSREPSETAEALGEHANVVSVYETTGHHNVLAVVRVAEDADLDALIETITTDAAVSTTTASPVSRTVCEYRPVEPAE